MADIESTNWSETAASNNAASPNGAPEGMAPSGVNDTIREVMGASKREWNRSHPTVTSSGTNTITLTYTTAPGAYIQGQTFSFIAGGNNSGATTLNVNGLGAKNVTKNGTTALGGGEILINAVITVRYDGTQFQLVEGVLGATLPTLTNHALQVGAGTTTPTQLAPGAAGTALTSAGASSDPFYAQVGFRNWLLNGAMNVWQRGAGGSASIAVAATTTAYTADRWYLKTAANQAYTVAQTAITTVTGLGFAARVQRNSGQTGTGQDYFAQPFDTDVINALIGQTIVVSAYVSTGANWSPTSGTLSCFVYFGTGAVGKRNSSAYTGETNITATQNIAAGTAVAKYTFATGAVPAGTTQMELQFTWTPTGTASTNDWFQISGIQLEIGSTPTALDQSRLNITREIAECQRFFQKSFLYATAPAQSAGVNGSFAYHNTGSTSQAIKGASIILPTRMRSAPSVTTYNPSAANANWRDVSGSADVVYATLDVQDGIFSPSSSGNLTGGNLMRIHYTLDADI